MFRFVFGTLIICLSVAAFAAGVSPLCLLGVLLGVTVLGLDADSPATRWEE